MSPPGSGRRGRLRGSLVLLYDVDAHTCGFGGAKRYFEGAGAPDQAAGVLIGYPGMDHVVRAGGACSAPAAGPRHRRAFGVRKVDPGAIAKAAHPVRALRDMPLPDRAGPGFPLPARSPPPPSTADQGDPMFPDPRTLNVDIRLTPTLDDGRCRVLRGASRESMRRGRGPARPSSRSLPAGRRTRCRGLPAA